MKVKFLPQNVEHEIEFNETVLHLAQRCDIHIQSVCKGLPSCAECRIQIKGGEHNVPPPGTKELSLIGTAYYIDQSRLACQLRCFGDLTVDLSEQIEKEGRASKRPQGRASRADGEESHAIKGNIIEDYKDLNDVTLVEKLNPNEERVGHDNFYKSMKGNPNQQQGNRGGGGGNGGNREGGGQGKRRRNRNRNRNRNRQGENRGGGQPNSPG
jgi:2Fe-2S ferredoxin